MTVPFSNQGFLFSSHPLLHLQVPFYSYLSFKVYILFGPLEDTVLLKVLSHLTGINEKLWAFLQFISRTLLLDSSNSSVCGSPMKEKLQHLSQVRNHGISNYSVQDRLWFLEAALCKPSSWSSRGPISSFKQVTVTAWQGQSKTTPRMISVSTPCSIPCRDSEQDTDSYRNLQPKYQSSDSQTWFVQMQVPCRHWYPLQELGAGVLQRVLSQCWGGRAPGPLPLSPGMRQIFGRCERGSYYWFLLCLLALGLYTPCLETSFNTYLN